MKKILVSLAACALFLASCSDSEKLEGVEQSSERLNFSTSIGKATRAAEFTNDSWKQGDKFMIHAYQHQPTGWTSYFTQELEKGETAWTLNGDHRYRLPYATKYISIFPQEVEGDFSDNGTDFTNTYPSVTVDIDNYNGYYPDLIASVTNVEALDNKVDMKFRHLLSQINIGVEEYKDAIITIKDIKFKKVPSEGTYIFNEPEGRYGHWVPTPDKVKAELIYPFSKENSFTTTGLAVNGSYIFGDGGNFAAGDNYKYVYSDGNSYSKTELPKKLENSMMVLPTAYANNNTVIEFTYSATDVSGNPIGNNTNLKGTINPKDLKVDWTENYRYLYMIKFNFDGNKLKFDVTVDKWENYNNGTSEDNDGMVDSDYDTSVTVPIHIYPNDKNLNINNRVATYTIPTDILPKETEQLYTIALIFDDTTSEAGGSQFNFDKVNIVIPQLPINFPLIKVDANLITSATKKMAFAIDNPTYTGTVSFVDHYGSGKTINIGAFDFNMPNGSAIVSNGYLINGDMNANNGLVNLDGVVTGNIYVKGNGTVNIKSNDGTTRAAASDKYKTYATSSITNNAVSKWYGFGFSVNDIVNIASPGTSLPDFLNLGLGLSYAGAYANFNFNNQNKGFSWKEMRNLRYDFYGASSISPIAQALLKNEMHLNFTTPEDLAKYLNMPVDKLKSELNKQVALVEAMAKKYAALLPAHMAQNLMQRVNEMKEKVDYFCNKLPTVDVPNMPNLPIATFVPASDNIDLSAITKLVGTPEDKIPNIPSSITDLANIGKLLEFLGKIATGEQSLTLFMLINFFDEFTSNTQLIESVSAQIATLEADKAKIQNEIDRLPEAAALAVLEEEFRVIKKPSKFLIEGGKNEKYNGSNDYYNKYTDAIIKPDKAGVARCNELIGRINAAAKPLYAVARDQYDQINVINTKIGTEPNNIAGALIGGSGLKKELAEAKNRVGVFDLIFENLQISQDMIGTITAIAPYLATATNILNTINTTVTSIQDKNPWIYPMKAPSNTPFNSVSVEAKFEYATSKFIYVTK